MSSGVPGSILVLSWRLLGVSQGSLGRVREASWLCLPCVFLYLVAIAGIFVSDILAYPGEIVFFDHIRS